MRGYPGTLNTKADVYNLLTIPEFADKVKAGLQEMVDTRKNWIVTKKLKKNETGITDDTHKVVIIYDEIAGQEEEPEVKERYQSEYKDDPGAALYRLGFTLQEAQEVLNHA